MTARAIHFGPSIDTVGGTQSVIRVIRDRSVGADVVDVVPTWTGPSQARNAALTAAAARIVMRCNRDAVLHFHVSRGGAWAREGALIHIASRRGLRVAATLHGDQVPSFVRAHTALAGRVLGRVAQVICLSQEARDAVGSVVNERRVHVVPNPVELDHAAPSAADVPPVALFAGAVSLRKGADVLVEAWRQIVKDGIAGECWIVGPVADFTPPEVERLVVKPAVHPTQVAGLIRSARVVVLPSRSEAMPMILAEALAAARPVVATAVGGVGDIVADPSMVIPPEDSAALAEGLARFLEDPGLAADAGRRGQSHIERTRSPETIDRHLRAIYSLI